MTAPPILTEHIITSCLDNKPYITGVSSDNIDIYRGVLNEYIVPAIDDKEYTLCDVIKELKEQYMQLWIAVNIDNDIIAALTTKIDNYPQGKTCTLVHMGGNWDNDLINCFDILEAWAKQQGANRLLIYGRVGWERVLKERFNKKGIILEAEL